MTVVQSFIQYLTKNILLSEVPSSKQYAPTVAGTFMNINYTFAEVFILVPVSSIIYYYNSSLWKSHKTYTGPKFNLYRAPRWVWNELSATSETDETFWHNNSSSPPNRTTHDNFTRCLNKSAHRTRSMHFTLNTSPRHFPTQLITRYPAAPNWGCF